MHHWVKIFTFNPRRLFAPPFESLYNTCAHWDTFTPSADQCSLSKCIYVKKEKCTPMCLYVTLKKMLKPGWPSTY